MLRPGNAGSSTAADHITAARLALAPPPKLARRRALIRAGSGGGTHEFLTWLTRPGQRLQYPVGFTITDSIAEAIGRLPAAARTPACDAGGQVRDGARVAELTGMLNLSSWPAGMRLIVRQERPHPGAQLRFTTSTATASPVSPPAPEPGSSLTWNYGTGAAPRAKTGSFSRGPQPVARRGTGSSAESFCNTPPGVWCSLSLLA